MRVRHCSQHKEYHATLSLLKGDSEPAVAKPLQSELVFMDLLSPQPYQESLPLGAEMQIASQWHFLGRCSNAFWYPKSIHHYCSILKA